MHRAVTEQKLDMLKYLISEGGAEVCNKAIYSAIIEDNLISFNYFVSHYETLNLDTVFYEKKKA